MYLEGDENGLGCFEADRKNVRDPEQIQKKSIEECIKQHVG